MAKTAFPYSNQCAWVPPSRAKVRAVQKLGFSEASILLLRFLLKSFPNASEILLCS